MTSSDCFRLERNKENFVPPFYCCQDAHRWEANDSYKSDLVTFDKFQRVGDLSYHLHRHNLQRVRPCENSKEAYQLSMFVQKPVQVKHGEGKETILSWDREWTDFYVPSDSVQIGNEIHSCHGWGLAMVDYASMIDGRFGKTGLSMDVYCEHHSYFFHVIQLELIEPGKSYSPLSFESSAPPIRSTLMPIYEDDSDDDFLWMAPPPLKKKKLRADPKRKSIAEETIVEDDWLYV